MLNAFRHQRLLRIALGGENEIPVSAQRLSASKVTAPATVSASAPQLSGAQRLSASKVTAPRGLSTLIECAQVLNAFRHQRLLRRSASARRRYRLGAQRLSASKVTALYYLQSSCGSQSGAQRLSASKVTALDIASDHVDVTSVLNAFRHQRLLRG